MLKYFVFAVMLGFAGNAVGEDHSRLITVNGQGMVANSPDMLEFSIYIEERGESASKMAIQVNYKSKLVVDLLTDNGVQTRDIQSMQLNLHPWYERDRNAQLQKGFVLSRHIRITLRDFSQYAVLLDELIKIGAQRIDNFQYRIEDAEKAYLKALDEAIENAHLRARKAAKALGVKVGKVINISEQSSYSPAPRQQMRASRSGDSNSFLPGQMNTSASVSVQFEIID